MEKEVFSFGDFLNRKVNEDSKDNDIKDDYIDDTDVESQGSDDDIIDQVDNELKESILIENSYILYKDKSEVFSCDIYVEGSKTDETIARIIIESDEWTLMFPGDIKNGKVEIPIKKLNLFDEGQTGKIRLEVIAEGSMFIPWEDDFKVKLSKKVTVSVNEKKSVPKKTENKVGVKVNVMNYTSAKD